MRVTLRRHHRANALGLRVEDGRLLYQTFDAFGNAMTPHANLTGVFAWRGQEGSVSDKETNLVYMQSRHYDPTIGRFLQADTLRMASMTTQGMNRYIYTENDPVNMSDPSGHVMTLWGGLYAGIMLSLIAGAAWLTYQTAGAAKTLLFSVVANAVAGMIGNLLFQLGQKCDITKVDWDDVFFWGMMGAGAGYIGLTPAGGYVSGAVTTQGRTILMRALAAGGLGFLGGLIR